MWELLAKSNSNAVHNQSLLVLASLAGLCIVPVGRKLGIPAALLLCWVLWSGLRVVCFGISPYQFDLSRYFHFSHMALRDLLVISMTTFAAVSSSEKMVEKILNVIAWVSIGNAALLVTGNSGMWYNPAMDASFTACCLPLVWRVKCVRILSLLSLIAIIKSGSSTAFLAVVVCVLCHSKSMKWSIAVLGAGTLVLPFIPLKHALFWSNGRTNIWGEAWDYFRDHEVWLGGFGTGTYTLHEGSFPFKDVAPRLWIWLHNDWLQIGFEQGAIGLALALLVFGNALRSSRKNAWVFSAIMTFGFCMVTQPMLRNVVGGLYGALLVRRAYAREY